MAKNKYVKAMENIHISEEAKAKILSESIVLNKKERTNTMSKRKITVIAAAAAMIFGITAFAASGMIATWCSSSSSDADYKELPTKQQCIKDVGYAPVLIEEFENGYAFDEGSIVSNALEDENRKAVEKFKSFSFTYTKNGDKAYISQEKYNSDMENHGQLLSSDRGIDIYYTSYTNKLVPPDYKMTDEDQKAEAKGELVFSYGSAEVEIHEVQGISWMSDSMHYNITQIDGKLTPDDLIEMAHEIENRK